MKNDLDAIRNGPITFPNSSSNAFIQYIQNVAPFIT